MLGLLAPPVFLMRDNRVIQILFRKDSHNPMIRVVSGIDNNGIV